MFTVQKQTIKRGTTIDALFEAVYYIIITT